MVAVNHREKFSGILKTYVSTAVADTIEVDASTLSTIPEGITDEIVWNISMYFLMVLMYSWSESECRYQRYDPHHNSTITFDIKKFLYISITIENTLIRREKRMPLLLYLETRLRRDRCSIEDSV